MGNSVILPASGGGTSGNVKLEDGDSSTLADVLDLTNSNPLTVAIVDTNGDQIASFGGGVQYTEGDVDASITGTATLMEVSGNTLQPIQGSVADGLLVNLGSNNDVTVTGTVAATQSGTWNITNVSGTVSLPTGASTAANQATMITSLSNIDAGTPAALGQTTMAASMPVVIASNQTAIPITDNAGSITVDGTVAATQSGTWNITNVSGTVSLPTGAATETTLSSILGKYTSATATLSNVSASATSVTALSSNASRESAIFYNDSTSACYLKFGTTASTTSFTYKLRAAETLIVDGTPVYTGRVDAIWDSATGSMRVTELT